MPVLFRINNNNSNTWAILSIQRNRRTTNNFDYLFCWDVFIENMDVNLTWNVRRIYYWKRVYPWSWTLWEIHTSDNVLWWRNDNQYHLLTLKISNNNSKSTCYIDWIKVSEIEYHLNKSINFWNGNTYIWNRVEKNQAFDWLIDEVKIYNRALSDQEILQQAKIAGF